MSDWSQSAEMSLPRSDPDSPVRLGGEVYAPCTPYVVEDSTNSPSYSPPRDSPIPRSPSPDYSPQPWRTHLPPNSSPTADGSASRCRSPSSTRSPAPQSPRSPPPGPGRSRSPSTSYSPCYSPPPTPPPKVRKEVPQAGCAGRRPWKAKKAKMDKNAPLEPGFLKKYVK